MWKIKVFFSKIWLQQLEGVAPVGVIVVLLETTGKGTLGKKSYVCTDDFSFKKAHYTVLQQSSLVDPYIEDVRITGVSDPRGGGGE